MYSTKIFSVLCLLAGTIILSLGIYMKWNNIVSTGIPYRTRLSHNVTADAIDGNGTLSFGIILLLASLISYQAFIAQRKEREQLKKEEDRNDEVSESY